MEIKEQIKRSVSITDVVSQYVNLKPAGKYLKSLCPFHTEKTPSFYVMPEKDNFSCYGCNKFGDIFTFVQEIENLSFPDAMKFLIDKFNIPIEYDKQQSGKFVKKDIYDKINRLALKYFRENLLDGKEGKKAAAYLKQRGISQQTIERFNLGYAENRWDGLTNFFQRQSADIEKAIELGLLIKSDNRRVYDRFRGRIIFPIFSESGAPIAFGGRTIFDEPSKYLNSPDTPVYKKSKHLYGFNLSKNAMRESKKAILVEGYFDVVSLFQHGVENVAASLGTALTEKQIYLLKRFSDRIYIFYDTDKAGVNAAIRGIEKMFEQNINPGIISFTGGEAKDPDDFIREKGLGEFNELVDRSTDGFRFLVGKISQKYDTKVPEQKSRAIQSIMSFVEKMPDPIIRNEYTHMVADFFKVEESVLQLKKRNNGKEQDTERAVRLPVTLSERIFLESLLALPLLIGEIKELITDDILSVLSSRHILRMLMHHFNPKTNAIDDLSQVTAQLSPPETMLIQDIYEHIDTVPDDRAELEERLETAFLEFHDMLNRRRAKQIDQEIKIAERQNDKEAAIRLAMEKSKERKLQYQQKQTIGGTVD
jgi:DNA primase